MKTSPKPRHLVTFTLAAGSLIAVFLPGALLAGNGQVNAAGTIDTTVNLRFPPTAADLTEMRTRFTQANAILWDATEGQMRFGNVTFTCGSSTEDLADMWTFPQNARAGLSFYYDGSGLGRLGSHITHFFPDDRNGTLIAHEYGHLALGCADEYAEAARGLGPCIDAANLTERNQCLMQQSAGFSQTEFCTVAGHELLLGDGINCPAGIPASWCARWNSITGAYETSQHHAGVGIDCWTHIVNNYGGTVTGLAAPAGLPIAAAPGGIINPTFIDNCDATDTVMLILDRSGSMAWNTKDDNGEVFGDGIDNDGDGIIDESRNDGVDNDGDGVTDEEDEESTESRLEFLTAAARAWLQFANNKGVRAGVVSFSDTATLDQPFQEVTNATIGGLEAAVNGLASGGGTAIGTALKQTFFTFDAEAGATNKTAFLITDGVNTTPGSPDPASCANQARARGIRVFTISTGAASDDGTLDEIAGATSGAKVDASDAGTLVNAFAQQWARYRNIGTIIPMMPYALDANSRIEDDFRLINPDNPNSERTGRRPEIWALGLEQRLPLSREKGFPKTNRIQFLVEDSTPTVSLIFAGNMDTMAGFGLNALLSGPAGPNPNFFDSQAPHPLLKVKDDPYFLLLELEKPNPGLWEIELLAGPGGAPVQTGNLTIVTDNPNTELFTELSHHVVKDTSKPLELSATPIHYTDLKDLQTLGATVKWPDGSTHPLPLQRSEDLHIGEGEFIAKVNNFPQDGLYEVRVFSQSGPGTTNNPGESIFAPSPPSTVAVSPFERGATEYFFVKPVGKWKVCTIDSGQPLTNLQDVRNLFEEQPRRKRTSFHRVINFLGIGPGGNFGNDRPYPGSLKIGEPHDDFATRVTGQIEIEQSGEWTFGFLSDDGGGLWIDGSPVAIFDANRNAENSLGTVRLQRGLHRVEFFTWNRRERYETELFVASQLGKYSSFRDADFELLLPVRVDLDQDGLDDEWERCFFDSITNVRGNEDDDNDGLTNHNELRNCTNPFNKDTDGDGLPDGDEVNIHGTSPTLIDTDGDGITDYREVHAGVDPLDPSAPLIGDLNLDRSVNSHDIDRFVLALVDPPRFLLLTGQDPNLVADANGDGKLDSADIDAFLDLLHADGPIPDSVSLRRLAALENPQADNDEDGRSNVHEAWAGTDPSDQTDYLRIIDVNRDPRGLAISWASVTGWNYAVEFSQAHGDHFDEWETVNITRIIADGRESTFIDQEPKRIDAEHGFYRIRAILE